MIEIRRLTEASERSVADLDRLVRQLRTNHPENAPVTLSELKKITDDKNAFLIVAVDEGRIVGMATLYVLQKLAKRIGHVEDVVVDESHRGQGLGEKILRRLIEQAREENVGSLFLTSRPERVAGNKLYLKLGFMQKETNPYTLKL